MKKKKYVITIFLAIVCLFSTIGCNKEKYTKEQAMVKKTYDAIKENLLDPDSIIIYDCYGWSAKSEKQYDKQWKENEGKSSDEEVELPDDMYSVYYYIGARNKMGGISDEEYIYMYDLNGNLLDYSSESDREEWVEDLSYASAHHDLLGQFINPEYWKVAGWGNADDYNELVKSDDFEKIDPEKILNN